MRYKQLPKNVMKLSKSLNPLKLNTNQLINRVFFIFVPILLGFSLLFSFYSSQRALEASQRLKITNDALLAINERQKADLDTTRKDIKDLRQALLCIAEFFSTENRDNLKIETYDPCTLINRTPDEPAAFSNQQSSSQAQSNFRSEVSSSSNDTPNRFPAQPNTSQRMRDTNQPESSPKQEPTPEPAPEPEPNVIERTIMNILNLLGVV